MASKTDQTVFDDDDQLSDYMTDMRAQDTRQVSEPSAAREIIDTFRAATDVSPWASLDRSEVADRLHALIDNPRAIHQGQLNLCGPAALICIWASRDPVAFANYATQLFDNGAGDIGSLVITPSQELLNQDYAQMRAKMSGDVTEQADWMVLGALRNTTNVFWQGEWVGDPAQELAGLTRPEELASWLEATGIYSSVRNQGNWVTPAGIPQATSVVMAEGTDVALLIHINLINAAKKNREIDHTFLLNQFPNHYVVALNEIMVDIRTKDVSLSVWTWGEDELNLVVPMQDFVDNYYGAIVARLS